jgi:NitT/TauT family transport system substrate-binding protein
MWEAFWRRQWRLAVAGIFVMALGLAGACGPAPGAAPRAAGAEASQGPDAASSQALRAPAAAPVRLRVAYSELTPGQAVPWISYEAGVFARHGLDVELRYIASAQTVAAVLADEVEIAIGGGQAAISSRLAGSDVLIFLGVTNWLPYDLMVMPEINSVDDLRGRTLGVSRFGSSSDVATRRVLRRLGLEPERDVVLIQTGSLQERIAAMRAGAVAGGLASPPQTTLLRRAGFKTLLLNSVAFAKESWLRTNEAVAQAFTNAMLEGIHFAKTNRAVAERVIGQYLKLDDPEMLAEAYDYYIARHMSRVPYPSLEAGQQYLESVSETDPRAAGARVGDFFDLRFLERAVASGLIEQLYGKD